MPDFHRLAEIEGRSRRVPSAGWRQRIADTGIVEDTDGQPVAVLGTSKAARLPVGEFIAYAPADVQWLADQLRIAWALLEGTRIIFASEFRVPVPGSPSGGYAEVVVRRDGQSELWAVTDGALTGLRAWTDGAWRHVSEVGRRSAFRWTLDEAMLLAQQVAELEAHSYRKAAAGGRNTSSSPGDRP